MFFQLKSTLYFDFCFVSKLIWSINSHWNKTSTQTFHKITYNTIFFGTKCYRDFGLIFSLYLEGSRLFRLYLSLAIKFKKAILLDKEKISAQKLYNTGNQNNSVINSYQKWLISKKPKKIWEPIKTL